MSLITGRHIFIIISSYVSCKCCMSELEKYISQVFYYLSFNCLSILFCAFLPVVSMVIWCDSVPTGRTSERMLGG